MGKCLKNCLVSWQEEFWDWSVSHALAESFASLSLRPTDDASRGQLPANPTDERVPGADAG